MKVSEISLVYKSKVRAKDRPKIVSSKEAYEISLTHWNASTIELKEEFKVLLLNRAGHCIGIIDISTGSTKSTVVEPKMVFIGALKTNADSIILVHNHPSGQLKPSENDLLLTQRLVNGGKLLEVQVLDHLIISKEGYFSMADERII